MTIKEIVMQVADTYTLNTRSTEIISDTDECRYQTKDGNMCAVGMCMSEPSLHEFGSFIGSVRELHYTTMNQRNEQGLDYLLKEEYKGHPIEFWSELQGLHDIEDLWDENGLNHSGKIQASKIINEFKNI